MRRFGILFSLLVIFTGGYIHAQDSAGMSEMSSDDSLRNSLYDLSLHELMKIEVVSTSYFESSDNVTPGYSVAIPLNNLERRPARNLYDIAQMQVPGNAMGFFPRFSGAHAVRGIMADNNTKTSVSLDGLNIGLRNHVGYSTPFLSPLLGDIKQVEFTNGAGAITQGSGAINGFINLIPKNGTDDGGLYVNSQYGVAENLISSEVGYGYSYGDKKDIYIYGGVYKADGFEPDSMYGGNKVEGDIAAYGFGYPGYRGAVYWRHDKLKLNSFIESHSPNKGSGNKNQNHHGYTKTNMLGIAPSYELTTGDNSSVNIVGALILADLLQMRYKKDPDTKELYETEDGGSESHQELKVVYRNEHFANHKFAAGALIGGKQFRQRALYFGDSLPNKGESTETNWEEISVFAEDLWSVQKFTFTLGVRYDKYMTHKFITANGEGYNEIDGHISPRVGAHYKFNDKTSVKIGYRHGFRMPDANYYNWNLYFNDIAEGLGFERAPALKPESSDGYELNLTTSDLKSISVSVSLYYNIFYNQLSYEHLSLVYSDEEVAAIGKEGFSFVSMTQNLAQEEEAFGGEVDVNWKINKNLKLNTNYSMTKVGEDLPQRMPSSIVKSTLSYSLKKKLHLAANYVYFSGMTNITNPQAIDNLFRKDRHTLSLSASFDYKMISLYAKAMNVARTKVPDLTFTTNKPYHGMLGSDQMRIYAGAIFHLGKKDSEN